MRTQIPKPVAITIIVVIAIVAVGLSWWFYSGKKKSGESWVDPSVYPKIKEDTPTVESSGGPPPGPPGAPPGAIFQKGGP